MVWITCKKCKKEFFTYPSNIKRGYGKYCSNSCRGKDKVAWNKGRSFALDFEYRNKLSLAHKGKTSGRKGKIAWNRGKTTPLEVREKQRLSASNWKGGITPENKLVRKSFEMRKWRKAVLKRDNYTCQACGQHGGVLDVDHELPFAIYPDLKFEILNGRVLCRPCHRKTPTYGGKLKKYEIFTFSSPVFVTK